MNTIEDSKRLAADIVDLGRGKGADTVSVSIYRSVEFNVSARRGEVELLTEAESSYLEAEVSRDRRRAVVHTCDLSEETVSSILDEAVELARHTEMDEFFSLPDQAELGSAADDLDLFDPRLPHWTVEEKTAAAREMEACALAADPRIIPDTSQVDTTLISLVRANSLGFCEGYRKSLAGFHLSCAADDRGSGENSAKKQSDYWFSSSVSLEGLERPEVVARTAVERVVRKLGAVKPRTRAVPVVFDPLTAASLIGSLAQALSGERVYQKLTYLADRMGGKAASDAVTIVDDPLLPGQVGSRPFDGEGVRSRRNMLVEHGVLRSFLLSTYSANKLRMTTTGSSGGASNLSLAAGSHTPEEIISSVDDGLYVTFLSGQGADIVTGDYSRGAQGIWIDKGKLSYPVNEFTVAGTFDDILGGIGMVGNDLKFNRRVVSPTIRVEKLTVSGT